MCRHGRWYTRPAVEKIEIGSELVNDGIERCQAVVDTGSEHRALHGADDELGERGVVDAPREAVARAPQERLDTIAPGGEDLGKSGPYLWVALSNLNRQTCHR
jgi:hypothetical protein